MLKSALKKYKVYIEYFIQFLIFYSIVCFTLETFPSLDEKTRKFLIYSEIFTVLVFTAEYLGRIYYTQRKLSYIFSFYGIIDLLAILPFYLATQVDLRSLRILRMVRFLRVLKLARYNKALNRLTKALQEIKEELLIFLVMSLIIIYLSSVGIYHFEHPAQPDAFKSIFDCLWWAVVTLTTVGYGDIYPVTNGGRFFTFIILMIGLGLVSVPTALIASALTSLKRKEEPNTEQIAAIRRAIKEELQAEHNRSNTK